MAGCQTARGTDPMLVTTFLQDQAKLWPRPRRLAVAGEERDAMPQNPGVRDPRNVGDKAASHFDLRSHLLTLRKQVDVQLAEAIVPAVPERLYESMRYSVLSEGKRLRPILCLTTCEMSGGSVEVAMPTACALEMLHAATLIHDDLPLMDDDDFRRGKPSNHKIFGEGMALLAGDALLAYSLEFILVGTKGVTTSSLLKVMETLIHVVGASGLTGGQAIDLECQGRNDIDLATLELMHARKTGSLIEAAAVTGAILGGASAQEIAKLQSYAQKVGLAYQIVDDAMGKLPGRDHELGKCTFPRLLGIAGSRARAREIIDSAKADLIAFGERADPLMAIAEFACARGA